MAPFNPGKPFPFAKGKSRSTSSLTISTAVLRAAIESRPICATGPVNGCRTPITTSLTFCCATANELNDREMAATKHNKFFFIDLRYFFK